MNRNRWLNGAIPAVAMHLSIGAVYAWSVFTQPVMESLNASLQQVQWAFSIAIFFLGMSAAFLGSFVEKYGPKVSSAVCGVFYGIGMIGSGFAIRMDSLLLLYLFYGAIGGIGLGIGYIAPIKTLVNWFYDRRGLATGLAIMGFGFASAIAGPVITNLISTVGLVNTFFIMGTVYLLVILVAAYLIHPAPEQYIEAAAKAQTGTSGGAKKQFTVSQAVRTWQFYGLWMVLFINITCGIALISVASPMVQEMTGVSAIVAASIVGAMGVFNGGGRFVWASLSDYLGRPIVYVAFFVLQVIAMVIMNISGTPIVFQVLLYLIMTCYGGGFSCMPAYLSDIYGTKQLSAIHGRILTAWAMAGIAGPVLVAWCKGVTNSYQPVILVFCGLYAVAGVVAATLMSPKGKAVEIKGEVVKLGVESSN